MQKNNKGMVLVMAIMIVTILIIMAAGFVTFSVNTNKSVQNQTEKVRLYWAAESGSNYSVDWWVSQEMLTRVAWPYYYDPEESKSYTYNDYTGGSGLFAEVLTGNSNHDCGIFSGGMGGGSGDDDDIIPVDPEWDYNLELGTDADGGEDNNWEYTVHNEFKDTNGHIATLEDRDEPGYLPETCRGIATNDQLYLHPSSEIVTLKYLNSQKTYTLYLLRYKGERVDKKDTAVWVMDTWAIDNESKDIHRVLMSNLFNFIPTNTPWLQYNEGMVHTQYASSNGRKGVYKAYDFRFGQSYFAEQVRFDYKSGVHTDGPTFYGRIESSAPTFSKYGSREGGIGNLIPQGAGIAWEKGLFAEFNGRPSLNDVLEIVNTSVAGGWDTVDPLDVDNIVWDWPTVVENSSTTPTGIYMLSELKYPVGSEIDIELRTEKGNDGELETFADISIGISLIETVSVSDSGIQAIAVPTQYSDVSIFGNSSDNFSLITEEDLVAVTDHFYLTEMGSALTDLSKYNYYQLEDPTMDIMADLYEAMYNKDVDGNLLATSHLSIISGLALQDMSTTDLAGIPALGNRKNQIDLTNLTNEGLIFTTCGYYLGYGELGVPSTHGSVQFYNIGSYILQSQEETTGSNSFKGTISLIQDKRFYDDDFSAGIGWGSGPGDDSEPKRGLNNNYRWSGGYVGSGTITEQDFIDIM